jgi:hypothetical protein
MPFSQDDARRVIEQHPELHYFGYGQPPVERIQPDRDSLLKDTSLELIVEAAEWCRAASGVRGQTSYALKHRAEEEIPDVGYVSNGQMIAAMLLAGYVMTADSGYNPTFRPA